MQKRRETHLFVVTQRHARDAGVEDQNVQRQLARVELGGERGYRRQVAQIDRDRFDLVVTTRFLNVLHNRLCLMAETFKARALQSKTPYPNCGQPE